MKRNVDLGLLVLRVAISAMLLTHGFPKLIDFIGGNTSLVGNPIGVGSFLSSILVLVGEVIAPVLVLIGFKSRLFALLPAITMGVAAFIYHGGDSFAQQEKALLYLAGFITISLMGAGRISMDKK